MTKAPFRPALAALALIAALWCAPDAGASGMRAADPRAAARPVPAVGDIVGTPLCEGFHLGNSLEARGVAPGRPWWLSRDPLGERGGLNLYGFVNNDPVNRWDYLGLDPVTDNPSIRADLLSIATSNPELALQTLFELQFQEEIGRVDDRLGAGGKLPSEAELFGLVDAAVSRATANTRTQIASIVPTGGAAGKLLASDLRTKFNGDASLLGGGAFLNAYDGYAGTLAELRSGRAAAIAAGTAEQAAWENGAGKFWWVMGHAPGALADTFGVNAALGAGLGVGVQDNVQSGLLEFIDDGKRLGRAGELALALTPFAITKLASLRSGTTRLWRAVEPEELSDVLKFGDYNIHYNSTFKRFAFDEASLDDFIKANPARDYTKTYIDIPTENLRRMHRHPDAGGVGEAIGIDVLENPTFYDWFDKVHVLPK